MLKTLRLELETTAALRQKVADLETELDRQQQETTSGQNSQQELLMEVLRNRVALGDTGELRARIVELEEELKSTRATLQAWRQNLSGMLVGP